MHFLIDADSALYKAGCAGEERWYEVREGETVVRRIQYKKDAVAFVGEDPCLLIVPCKDGGPLSHALTNLRTYIDGILGHPECVTHQLYIGGKGNFRYTVDPEYKAIRSPLDKPVHIEAMKDYMVKKYKAIRCHGEEADDTVSYLCLENPENNCIVSIDKDLRNTPGWHLNPDTGVMNNVSVADADLNFYRQLLMGDATDGITGIAGYGKVTAAKALPLALSVQEMCTVVWSHYTDKGYDDVYFIQQARLLWMLREKGVMWQPPIDLKETVDEG